MSNINTELCPNCKGAKVVFSTEYKLDEKLEEFVPIYKLCEMCQGEGKILSSMKELFALGI